MPTVKEKIAVQWQKPTTEAHWEPAEPPAEAAELEAAVRSALEEDVERGDVLVTFRRDGTRWRVQAEIGNGHGGSAATDPRNTLDLTRKAVEAVRRTGVQAEPGFSGDAHEPPLPLNPVE